MNISAKYLIVPINFDTMRKTVLFYDKDGKPVFSFDAFLDVTQPKWIMYYNMERFRGMELDVAVSPEMEIEFAMTEERPMEGVYDSYLRPTVHFTAARGWLNDPNGLVYHDGVYHLFYQHNPMAPAWGNMHWGHATSRDLLHWTEEDIALYPDELGAPFSGCGIRDERNVSGLSPDGNTLFFYYSAAAPYYKLSEGGKYTQCIAYSTDGGKTFVKYEGNPVLPWIAEFNRDPRVVWCEELGCYLMALYLTGDEYHLFTSHDLLTWERHQSVFIPNSGECPDLYPITADDGTRKWIFVTGNDLYIVGHMDAASRKFIPDQDPKQGHCGPHSYAAQTFSGVPDRTVQISWHKFFPGGTIFGCQMSVPMEVSLVRVNGEYFRRTLPVREFDTLAKSVVTAKGKAALSRTAAHDITIRAKKDSEDFTITLFGRVFEVKPKENLFVFSERRDNPMPLSVTGGDIEIRIITDTISLECFLDGGLGYSNFGMILDKNFNYMTVTSPEAEITVKELRSIYEN